MTTNVWLWSQPQCPNSWDVPCTCWQCRALRAEDEARQLRVLIWLASQRCDEPLFKLGTCH